MIIVLPVPLIPSKNVVTKSYRDVESVLSLWKCSFMEKILGLLALSLGKKFTVYAVGRVSVISVDLQSRFNQIQLRIHCVCFVYYKKKFCALIVAI